LSQTHDVGEVDQSALPCRCGPLRSHLTYINEIAYTRRAGRSSPGIRPQTAGRYQRFVL